MTWTFFGLSVAAVVFYVLIMRLRAISRNRNIDDAYGGYTPSADLGGQQLTEAKDYNLKGEMK